MSQPEFFDQDSEIALKAKGGDPQAFEYLVKKYTPNIFNFALHFFKAPDQAEDVTQEVFIRAFRFLHTYDPSRRFLTWLYSIARNCCIDRHRENARKEEVPIDDFPQFAMEGPNSDPLRAMELRESSKVLKDAIDKLPEKYRTPIILCYLDEMSYQDIGEVLGISLNNTKIRIFRAKKMLMELLGMEGEPT